MGRSLEDRLVPALIEGALGYIQHNEEPLAFEILCDHISEYNISISLDEYELITSLVECMKLDINAAPFRYLKQLVS